MLRDLQRSQRTKCKLGQSLMPCRNLRAYCIMHIEKVSSLETLDRHLVVCRHHLLKSSAQSGILGRALGRLTEYFCGNIKLDVSLLNSLFQHGDILHHDGFSAGLTDQSEHFRMAWLSEDDYLTLATFNESLVSVLYALLKLQYYRACAVDDLESETIGSLICLWRFAVSSDEQSLAMGIYHLLKVFLVDGHQSLSYKT